MCRLLGVSKQAYYKHEDKLLQKMALEASRLQPYGKPPRWFFIINFDNNLRLTIFAKKWMKW